LIFLGLEVTENMCHVMFLLNVYVYYGYMRVGFGFSGVTFRPSRVFHFRLFSRPSVETDEQSTEYWKVSAFLSKFKMLRKIRCADNVFVRFYFATL